jgi:hypothetical protein
MLSTSRTESLTPADRMLYVTDTGAGQISVPGAVNFCFGGLERNRLSISTESAVWIAAVAATGA